MGDRAEFPEFPVPPIGFLFKSLGFDGLVQHLQSFLSGGPSNKFPDLGDEDIHCAHGLIVVVFAHVESFEGDGIVVDDHWTVVVFGDVFLMLRVQVHSPGYYILVFLFILGEHHVLVFHCLAQEVDGLGVRDPFEGLLDQRLKERNQVRFYAFHEELQIVSAVGEDEVDQEPDVVLRERHQVVKIRETDFRLDHPEFRKVPRCVRDFSPERWTKRIHVR